MEDLVCIAVEVDDLAEQVVGAGLASAVSALWREALDKHQADETYIPDIVGSHLHAADADRRQRVEVILGALASRFPATP